MKKSQNGFSLVEILIVIVVVLAVAGVGYYAYSRTSAKSSTANTNSQVATPTPTDEIADINNAEDLDTVNGTLNELEVDQGDEDLNELDEALNTF